jgi:hypothetical protein
MPHEPMADARPARLHATEELAVIGHADSENAPIVNRGAFFARCALRGRLLDLRG